MTAYTIALCLLEDGLSPYQSLFLCQPPYPMPQMPMSSIPFASIKPLSSAFYATLNWWYSRTRPSFLPHIAAPLQRPYLAQPIKKQPLDFSPASYILPFPNSSRSTRSLFTK
ncbi:hypothetical protein SLE2022_084010 [Rubroshorea leprosula]